MSETITSRLQASDSLLKRFFVGLADTHNLSYRAHLCPQLVLNTFEFFKCPAGKFDHDIITVRNVFVQSTIFAAGDILQCQPGCQHRRYKGNREAGRLGSKGRRTGGTGIDFDNDDTVRYGIMGKLHIGSADDLYRFYYFICLFLKSFLTFLRDGQHRCRTEGISGMNTKRVNILDKADCDNIVLCIPDNFKFQFFPAKNGLFYKNLSYKACLQAAGADSF